MPTHQTCEWPRDCIGCNWRQPSTEHHGARKAITAILALVVWWNFLTGHILNNIRGFGA